MIDWMWVMLAAWMIVVVETMDLRLLGPYFTFSQSVFVLTGLILDESPDGAKARKAMARRLAYPVIAGALLATWNLGRFTGVVAAGVAVLIMTWPVVTIGLSDIPAARKSHLFVFYIVLGLSFGVLGLGGTLLIETVQSAVAGTLLGDLTTWMRDWLVTVFLAWLLPALGRALVRRIRGAAQLDFHEASVVGGLPGSSRWPDPEPKAADDSGGHDLENRDLQSTRRPKGAAKLVLRIEAGRTHGIAASLRVGRLR